jgi:hypothetical protein
MMKDNGAPKTTMPQSTQPAKTPWTSRNDKERIESKIPDAPPLSFSMGDDNRLARQELLVQKSMQFQRTGVPRHGTGEAESVMESLDFRP